MDTLLLPRQRRLRRPQQLGDGGGVGFPRFCFLTQSGASLRREAVELGLAVVLRKPPLALDPSLVLETPEGRVEGAFVHQQRVVRVAANEVRDGVAVQRPPNQGLEDQYVQRAAD